MNSLQSSLQGTTMMLGIDLYPRWIGTQAVLQGENPYTLETRQQIWQALYGSTNTPNGNPFGFYYPPAIVTLLSPFVMLGLSVGNAALLWCAFLWAILPVFLVIWSMDLPNIPNKTNILPIVFISG